MRKRAASTWRRRDRHFPIDASGNIYVEYIYGGDTVWMKETPAGRTEAVGGLKGLQSGGQSHISRIRSSKMPGEHHRSSQSVIKNL